MDAAASAEGASGGGTGAAATAAKRKKNPPEAAAHSRKKAKRPTPKAKAMINNPAIFTQISAKAMVELLESLHEDFGWWPHARKGARVTRSTKVCVL